MLTDYAKITQLQSEGVKSHISHWFHLSPFLGSQSSVAT